MQKPLWTKKTCLFLGKVSYSCVIWFMYWKCKSKVWRKRCRKNFFFSKKKKNIIFFLPFKLTPRFSLSFLLLNKLLMSSLVTKRSTFSPFCITTPANSFSNPSPFSPTANFGSPKNFPSLQGWSFPSKTSLKYENKVF